MPVLSFSLGVMYLLNILDETLIHNESFSRNSSWPAWACHLSPVGLKQKVSNATHIPNLNLNLFQPGGARAPSGWRISPRRLTTTTTTTRGTISRCKKAPGLMSQVCQHQHLHHHQQHLCLKQHQHQHQDHHQHGQGAACSAIISYNINVPANTFMHALTVFGYQIIL